MLAAPRTSGQVSDDLVHEPEEPPDESMRNVAGFALDKGFMKQVPTRIPNIRRESLLTRQLQPKDMEDDHAYTFGPVSRALSSSSIAELTSDNELTSPGTRGSSPSPPLPPVRSHIYIPPLEKHFTKEPTIAEHEDRTAQALNESEHKVESNLGRRRCITFACGKKAETSKEASTPVIKKAEIPDGDTDAPKRKCTITFNCPTRTKMTPIKPLTLSSRHLSPAPKLHKSPKSPKSPRAAMTKSRRGSDMTITTSSPTTLRKVPSVVRRRNKYADNADEEKLEAKRFHEFAVNAHADEEWTEEITCHRKRLTIKDTLHKENAGDAISDGGFDTDDEHGFANSSESDGDDSDFEWWAPGRSTAATSTDQLEHIRSTQRRRLSDSSLESAREANGVAMKGHKKQKSKTRAVKINRAPTPELPDSTDFVCGTLDEDRPLEQAYKLCIEQRKAAKHKVTPQDIDPTFPTSDPEMDEEDEEDEVCEEEDDDQQLFMHGPIDLNEDPGRRNMQRSNGHKKSPSPRRLKSPAPTQRVNNRSPAPTPRRRSLRSPPPPTKCNRHRSPAPRKLFGQSPPRLRSPPPSNRPTSPPNSRRSSVEGTPRPTLKSNTSDYLGTRPVPTRVASLPRVPTMTKIRALAASSQDDDEDDDDSRPRRVRGAIDIVKGLEKKRQRRKEKLYQKHCQKMKKEGERKPKPGKGAERMRELGLELAAYRGKKAEHMLSI
ncbi:hypothetical protein K461DRAFT_265361 [Myriangium duriaei CBS 260.36]|uniref:Extensin domain-containing protein n=1 Tax=Myriangium duriaei CBS 260.36 TaxID=1168546 RepID=A0A9P4J5P7_9PEZI|nr:hypothetical protein K461DRAFT_265361 [Myriangium duriaei CBS 260.36]